MALHVAGPHGSARGKLSGVVYGAAHTRWGKHTTSRAYAIPRDPRTEEQIIQRSKFTVAVDIANGIGSHFWRDPWRNAFYQLPGWNSLVSYLTRNLENGTGISLVDSPSPQSLGPAFNPGIVATSAVTPGILTLTWATDLQGDYAAATDDLIAFAIPQATPSEQVDYGLSFGVAARSAGTVAMNDLQEDVQYLVFSWFRHAVDVDDYRYSPVSIGRVLIYTTP